MTLVTQSKSLFLLIEGKINMNSVQHCHNDESTLKDPERRLDASHDQGSPYLQVVPAVLHVRTKDP